MVTIFEIEKAENVKENWTEFLRDIFSGEVKWIKNSNGHSLVCLDVEYVKVLVENIMYRVNVKEDGEKLIGTIENFWFVERSETIEDLKIKLAQQLKEFAIHYFNDLDLYKQTPDFKSMFPSIIKVLVMDQIEEIIKAFKIDSSTT